MRKEKILEKFKEWLNVPFQYRCCYRFGCDCVGLLIGVIRELDLYPEAYDIFIKSSAKNYLNGDTMLSKLSNIAEIKKDQSISILDIVLFKIGKRENIHLGIVSNIDPLMMIHAHYNVGKVVETILDKYWLDKISIILNLRRLESDI